MRTYQSIYPYFESKINKIHFKLIQRIELGNISNSERVFLQELLDSHEIFKNNLYNKPSVSNVNFEQCVNDSYKADPQISGVIIYVDFYKVIDSSKYAVQRFNLKR